MDARFTNQNFGAEHLPCSISSSSEGIAVAIRRILGEVICITPHTCSAIGHIKAFFTFVDSYRRCTTGPVIHLSLFSMLFPSMLSGNVIYLILINPPELLVLDPLDGLNLCLRHGQVEISLQPIPLISPLSKVLDHNLLITGQQFYRVLPEIRKVVGLSFIDDLRNLDLDLVVLEADDLEVLVGLSLDVNEVAIARVLLLDLVLDLCKELFVDSIPINE